MVYRMSICINLFFLQWTLKRLLCLLRQRCLEHCRIDCTSFVSGFFDLPWCFAVWPWVSMIYIFLWSCWFSAQLRVVHWGFYCWVLCGPHLHQHHPVTVRKRLRQRTLNEERLILGQRFGGSSSMLAGPLVGPVTAQCDMARMAWNKLEGRFTLKLQWFLGLLQISICRCMILFSWVSTQERSY